MVIIDPIWNLSALKSHDGHNVHTALQMLPSRICERDADGDETDPLAALQPAIEHALICIVESIVGLDAAEYVNEFLDEFSPKSKIPRIPGYE